jgi:uncharacterized membrane protein YedE/YeeE
MDYEQLISDIGIDTLQLCLGLAIGLIFGIGAAISQFCLRKLILDTSRLRLSSDSFTWALGLGTALFFTQLWLTGDAEDISEAQIIAAYPSLSGPIIGGTMFGIGMIFSRGCSSRHLVLLATGNLRSLVTLVTFALAAQLTYGGLLVPLRRQLQDLWRLDWASGQVHEAFTMPTTAYLALALIIIVISATQLLKHKAWPQLTGAILVGLAVALCWFTTSFIAYHSFNEILPQSITFSAPSAQALMALISLDSPLVRLGSGVLLGCFVGAFLVTLVRRDFRLTSFDQQHPMERYLMAGVLMGVGSVIAGGCSIGAGLSGTAVLAVNAIVTLVSIIGGGLIGLRLSAQFNPTS